MLMKLGVNARGRRRLRFFLTFSLQGLHQQAVDAWQTAIQLHPNAAEAKVSEGGG